MDRVLWISGRGDTQLSHIRAVPDFQLASNGPVFLCLHGRLASLFTAVGMHSSRSSM
jgi:hypothetical protein